MNITELKLYRKNKKIKESKIRPNVNILGWRYIRESILDRDNYACRICADNMDLNVHHIDYSRANNETSNLVTLCAPCHRAVHFEGYKPSEHDDYPTPWGLVE